MGYRGHARRRARLGGAPLRSRALAPRRVADITTAGALTQSRARLWRLPPDTRGRRHIGARAGGGLRRPRGHADDAARRSARAGRPAAARASSSVSRRHRRSRCGTSRDDEVVVFAYGAPPVAGQAEYLDDVEL